MTGFFSHARVEHDLEQQIAKFSAQFVHVVAIDRVGDLIGFFDRVRRDRAEILREIPIAAVRRVAQAGHDPEEAVDLRQTYQE